MNARKGVPRWPIACANREHHFNRTYHYRVAAPGFFITVPPEVPFHSAVTFSARDADGNVLASGKVPDTHTQGA